MKILVKHVSGKTDNWLPWVLLTPQGLMAASKVTFHTLVQTELKKQSNAKPQAFLVTDGEIFWNGDEAMIFPEGKRSGTNY